MRHKITQALDSAPELLGDSGFIGVNMRLEPHVLPPGYVSDAKNCRFRNGVVETRKGFVNVPWLNNISVTTITAGITRAGGTATVTTSSNHGLATNSVAQITGCDQAQYNGAFLITVTGATTFTYTVTGAPATPATGSPALKKVGVLPWGSIYGAGRFSDPNTGNDYTLIASGGSVYATRDNTEATVVALPGGESVTTPCTFVQAFDTVVLLRGFDTTPLAMQNVGIGFRAISETPTTITRSGASAMVTTPQEHNFDSGNLVIITGADQPEYNGEQEITVTSPTTFTYAVTGTPSTPATGDIRVNSDGTEPIPDVLRGLFINNRLILQNETDGISVSDFNSYTKYLPVVSDLRINSGSSDALVALSKFNDTTVIAFKEDSIYALSNFYGSLSQLQLDQITNQFGLVAPDSVAHCGSDLLFLSQMGVMSLRQTEQNKIQGVNVPLSDPIQPLIDRINWRYVGNAKAAYWDNKYYLAVPLDDAELLGPELSPVGLTALESQQSIPVDAGSTYRYVATVNDNNLVNGASTYTTSRDFVAAGSSVTLTINSLSQPIASSIKKITTGVNNAILVYDFLNQAWCGYDYADGFTVREFLVRQYQNLDRLFVITTEGWVVLYEEDFQDHRPVPYADLTMVALPSAGNIFRINTGITITEAASPLNGAATWGHDNDPTLVTGRQNLWSDVLHNAGFSPADFTVWSAPNTDIHQIVGGIRIYSDNGVPPVVVTTGSWANVDYHLTQEIISSVTTRGYASPGIDLLDFDWLCAHIQTWNPDYSLGLVMDGPYEESTIDSSITKNRARYTIFGRADYNITNANLDYATDHREDYSLLLGTGTGHAASFKLNDTSADIGRHQEFLEEFKVRKRGRSARAKINCSQGRFRLMGVKFESRATQTRAGAKT